MRACVLVKGGDECGNLSIDVDVYTVFVYAGILLLITSDINVRGVESQRRRERPWQSQDVVNDCANVEAI